MSVEGFFHGAHEVYDLTDGRAWVATFATGELADSYIAWCRLAAPDRRFVVMPV